MTNLPEKVEHGLLHCDVGMCELHVVDRAEVHFNMCAAPANAHRALELGGPESTPYVRRRGARRTSDA